MNLPFFLIVMSLSMLFVEGFFSVTLGECVILRSTENRADVFQQHMSDGCAASGGAEASILAGDLLAAIQAGKSVDLKGVVIQGDLVFDQLPPLSTQTVITLKRDRKEVKEGVKSDQVRLITQEISIQQSRLTGVLGTNSKQGDLVIRGALLMAGNTFEGPVDFSRTLFLGDVDFSSSTFQQESYFVQSRFHGMAQFDHAQFGVRARFHKAHFYNLAQFSYVQFSGMSEFLEVLFTKDSYFKQSVFQLGAGFSGAHFQGSVDFSQGTFQREAFFLYTIFDQKALFHETNFQGFVTFDKSRFNGLDDFSSATFAQGSPFAKKLLSPPANTSQEPLGRLVAYGIVLAFFIAAGLKLFIARRKKGP